MFCVVRCKRDSHIGDKSTPGVTPAPVSVYGQCMYVATGDTGDVPRYPISPNMSTLGSIPVLAAWLTVGSQYAKWAVTALMGVRWHDAFK